MIEDLGAWLKQHRGELDRGEAAWLRVLAAFDLAQGWALDGSISCAAWLIFHAGLPRASAYERLRVAHELRRRPLLSDAFEDGRVSYSAIRVLTRALDTDPEVDEALIALAEHGTIADVERAVRCYRLQAEQERPPCESRHRRGLWVKPYGDGNTRVELTVTDVEAAELMTLLQALRDRVEPVDESPRRDSSSELADSAEERADRFMDLLDVARAHLDDDHSAGVDRYLVHVVTVPGAPPSLLDGTPIHPAVAAQAACDATVVIHEHSPGGEPLSVGRKTRIWTTAQHRAALVRDGGHCRFPGCGNRIADLHHQRPWAAGGETNIDNGFLACRRHHRLLHNGFDATGDPNHHLNFYRPDGTLIGVTTPTNRTVPTTQTPTRHLTLVS